MRLFKMTGLATLGAVALCIGGSATADMMGAQPVVMTIQVYVKPEFHEEYATWYRLQQTKHKLPGVVYSYLLSPEGSSSLDPFTSVTIWESRKIYEEYMENIKKSHPPADLDEKRTSAANMLSAPPKYSLQTPIVTSLKRGN